jgi:hypothetical protein
MSPLCDPGSLPNEPALNKKKGFGSLPSAADIFIQNLKFNIPHFLFRWQGCCALEFAEMPADGNLPILNIISDPPTHLRPAWITQPVGC